MPIRFILGSLITFAAVAVSLGETPLSPSTDQSGPKDDGGTAGVADFDLSWHSLDGGGGMRSTGGSFELSGTIGQPDSGVMTGGNFSLTGGFWFEVLPSDCNEDGVVNLFDYDTFHTCLNGPGGGVLSPACHCYDFNGDGVVTLLDFATMQDIFNGQ